MNLDRLIGLEHYLNAETIKAYYEEGIITAPVAIKLYLVGAMRRSYWERKTTMAKKLGIPYATVKRACKKLKAEGFAFQDRFESRCEDHGETKYLRLWHLGPATVSGSGKGPEVNLLDTDRKGPEVNLPTDKKGPKVNLTLENILLRRRVRLGPQ